MFNKFCIKYLAIPHGKGLFIEKEKIWELTMVRGRADHMRTVVSLAVLAEEGKDASTFSLSGNLHGRPNRYSRKVIDVTMSKGLPY